MRKNQLQFKAENADAVKTAADKQNTFFPSVVMAILMLESDLNNRAIGANLTRLLPGIGYKKKTATEVATLLLLKEDSKVEELVFIPNIEVGMVFGETAPAPVTFRDYANVELFTTDFIEAALEPLEKVELAELKGMPQIDEESEEQSQVVAELLKTPEGQFCLYTWAYYNLDDQQLSYQRVLKTLKSYWGENNLVSLDTEFQQA